MTAALLAFLAVLVAGLGARDQVTIAGLSLRQGPRPSLLLITLAVTLGTTAFAAWAAQLIAPQLLPPARQFLAAIALALAGAESLLIVPRPRLNEPTHSLGAAAIVLLSHQLTDAARFLVFGIAVGSSLPVSAGLGGALAGAMLIAGGWAFPEVFTNPRTRVLRRLSGPVLLALAIWLGLSAMGTL